MASQDEKSFQEIASDTSCPPLVFRGAIDSWPANGWTVQQLADILGDRQLRCKIASTDHTEVQWETESMHVDVMLQQYEDWLQDQATNDNPLKHVQHNKFSCYIDYNYMKDMFSDNPAVFKAVDWSVFGLEGLDGEHSTLWIGSKGCYTPCHQDTYGFNLVAQITGRKRWYLFAPGQMKCLYPTRLPYEESSVYSQVNIRHPNLHLHSLFRNVQPYVVELAAGDVLYVPKQWWHFVECLESSISVNTWIPMMCDKRSRVDESICRLLFSSLSASLLTPQQSACCVNTGEAIQCKEVNMQYVNTALQHCYSDADSEHINWMQKFVRKFETEKVLPENSDHTPRPGHSQCRKRKRSDNTHKLLTDHREQMQITNSDKTAVQIVQVNRMQFSEFCSFLEKNFKNKFVRTDDVDNLYEVDNGKALNCSDNEKHSQHDSTVEDIGNVNTTTPSLLSSHDSTSTDKTDSCKQMKHITEMDMLQTILDPSVIKVITEIINEKFKTS